MGLTRAEHLVQRRGVILVMPQYINPGVAAAAGIDQFMVDRAAKQRQAMLDQITLGREERLKTADEQDAEIRRLKIASDTRAAEASAGIKEAEAFQKHIKDTYIAGDVIDPADLAKAEKLGIDLPRQMPPATSAAPPAASAERGMGMGPFAGMQGAVPPPTEAPPAAPPRAVFSGYAPERAEAQKQSKIDALVARAKTTKPGTPEWDQLAAEFAANKVTIPAATMRPEGSTIAPRTLIVSPDKKTLTERLPDGTMRPFVGAPLKTDIMLDAPQPKEPKDNSAHEDAVQARKDTLRNQTYNNAKEELVKVTLPYEEATAKVNELGLVLNQRTPESDALIAPLVLKATISGTGSGFRMTQPEINQVLGGTSKWGQLENTLRQWSTDPTKALKITEEQRTELRALAKAIRTKASKQLQKAQTARHALDDAKGPDDIHKIMTQLREDLTPAEDDQSLDVLPPGVTVRPGTKAKP